MRGRDYWLLVLVVLVWVLGQSVLDWQRREAFADPWTPTPTAAEVERMAADWDVWMRLLGED